MFVISNRSQNHSDRASTREDMGAWSGGEEVRLGGEGGDWGPRTKGVAEDG